jgi:GH15 family glucan-1,4-alpha-glucosidase
MAAAFGGRGMSDSNEPAYRPIGDYALVGDCRSAALISSTGSIDWLCWPRFDSPSIFAALLDWRRGGRFSVTPVEPFTTTRRYVGETAVLETTFHTATGVARLTDLMPVASEAEKARELSPDHELLRLVECLEGTVEIDVLFDPRLDYGRTIPRLIDRQAFGLVYEHRAQVIALRSEIPLLTGERPGARGRARLKAGDARTLSVTYDRWLPVVLLPLGGAALERIARSVAWWEAWMGACRYDGPYAQMVRRSAVTLKLMTYAPSGAVIAAPTASLPEQIGGVRNWDYRYCWLRDASLTMRAFDDLGFTVESEAFLSWVLHATRLTWPELQVLYDVYGEARIPESTLDHLEGYARSAPVRVGNAAIDQLQLDTYGEVIDAAWRYCERGGQLDRTTARTLAGLGNAVIGRWHEPDEGIWEPRRGRQHHTHSKAMCWVALDRLVRLCERRHVHGDARRFVQARDAIREAIEARGYNARLGSYVSIFDGETLDASLLLLSLMGYADPQSARMRGTLARVRERLGADAGWDGLLYRYRDEDDGLPGTEGAFGICSFWGVEARALEGDVAAARGDFERLLSFANDVGLFAEEIEPRSGAAIGNFPQAFTHVGLINAAVTLARLQGAGPAQTAVSAVERGHV